MTAILRYTKTYTTGGARRHVPGESPGILAAGGPLGRTLGEEVCGVTSEIRTHHPQMLNDVPPSAKDHPGPPRSSATEPRGHTYMNFYTIYVRYAKNIKFVSLL